MGFTSDSEWLIRTHKNWIAGPYSQEQVFAMIQTGKLTLEDEVCSGHSDWIYLYETEEVKKRFGNSVRITAQTSGSFLEEEEKTDPVWTPVQLLNESFWNRRYLGIRATWLVIGAGLLLLWLGTVIVLGILSESKQ